MFAKQLTKHSRLSRCSTTRGSSLVFSRFSSTKVEARKSFLFTERVFLGGVSYIQKERKKNIWLIPLRAKRVGEFINKNLVYGWNVLASQLLINLLVITLYSRFFTVFYYSIHLLGNMGHNLLLNNTINGYEHKYYNSPGPIFAILDHNLFIRLQLESSSWLLFVLESRDK